MLYIGGEGRSLSFIKRDGFIKMVNHRQHHHHHRRHHHDSVQAMLLYVDCDPLKRCVKMKKRAMIIKM